MKVIVIIPAAGLGTRMASARGEKLPSTSKQFTTLGGVPILVHTLRKFAACERVSEIYLALRKAEADRFRSTLEGEKFRTPVHLVEGGEHRQQSVGNALKAVTAAPGDIVLVHDAVRPFVDRETIVGVIEAVEKHGAAIAGVPAVDTIKQVERTAEGAAIRATIPREKVVLAQTPQGFRFDLGRKAFEDAEAEGFLGTDEAALLERMGQEVAVVMGSPRNLKITTPADLELAEFFLSQETRSNFAG
jgi:2-C-methyl-D-erythritol 4-phosphate cytidylyltransferase